MKNNFNDLRYKGSLVPIEEFIKMGVDLEFYETKGTVKFKNGSYGDDFIQVAGFAYKLSEDKKFAFIVSIENNNELEYTPLIFNEHYERSKMYTECINNRIKMKKDAKDKSTRIRTISYSHTHPSMEWL